MKRLLFGTIALLVLTVASAIPAHAAGARPTRLYYPELVRDTRDFGFWVTYFARQNGVPPNKVASPAVVNANIARHVGMTFPGNWTSGRRVGDLLGRMHLMNTPTGYQFHIDSFTDARSVVTIHWLFGRDAHTPIVRLIWTFSPVGWSITGVSFVRNS
jgi:hypothetical protein